MINLLQLIKSVLAEAKALEHVKQQSELTECKNLHAQVEQLKAELALQTKLAKEANTYAECWHNTTRELVTDTSLRWKITETVNAKFKTVNVPILSAD